MKCKCDSANETCRHNKLPIQCKHKEIHNHEESCERPCSKDPKAKCVNIDDHAQASHG